MQKKHSLQVKLEAALISSFYINSYFSITTGLYLGTSVFMIIQPIR